MKIEETHIEMIDGKEYVVKKLPPDFKLNEGVAKERTLMDSLSPADRSRQINLAIRKREAEKWKRRQRAKKKSP